MGRITLPTLIGDDSNNYGYSLITTREIWALNRILYKEIYIGRWADIPLTVFAQALLSGEEPYIVLESPVRAKNLEEWPSEYNLDKLFTRDDVKIRNDIDKILFDDISDDEIVIGATIQFYTYSKRFEVHYSNALLEPKNILEKLEIAATINGRSYLFNETERVEYNSSNQMVCFNATNVCFHNSFLLNCPSIIWLEAFNWKPSDNEGRVWVNTDNENIARFEYLHGPLRGRHNSSSHTDVMQRWIAKKSEVEKMTKKFNLVIKEFFNVSQEKLRN